MLKLRGNQKTFLTSQIAEHIEAYSLHLFLVEDGGSIWMNGPTL